MISVDEIQQRGRTARFPSIDFKFQNTGSGTAFLWQFGIEIMASRPDFRPAFKFDFDINRDDPYSFSTPGKSVSFTVTNYGWSELYSCRIEIVDAVLNRLVEPGRRTFVGNVTQFGEPVEIVRINYADVSRDVLNEFRHGHQRALERGGVVGVQLDNLGANWSCADRGGARHDGSDAMFTDPWRPRRGLLVTETGFLDASTQMGLMMYPSDTVYVAMLDPLPELKEKTFSISRKVPPGDVDRFHVRVAASRSCHTTVKFKFYLDKNSIIESHPFDINIWNPRPEARNDYLESYADLATISRGVDPLSGPVESRR